MKPRHAAALALVGWYLMLPPTAGVPGFPLQRTPNDNAPLSKWTVLQAYDSAAACNARQSTLFKHAERRAATHSSHSSELREWRDELAASQCIASDDPRLAK